MASTSARTMLPNKRRTSSLGTVLQTAEPNNTSKNNNSATTSSTFCASTATTIIVAATAVVCCFFATPVGSTGAPCGGDLTGSYGVVASPAYPETYPLNVECVWHIHANTSSANATETGVRLDLSEFNTVDRNLGNGLEALVVYASNPTNASSTPTAYTMFRGKPGIRSETIASSNEIWLRFRSRSSDDGSGQGSPGQEKLRFLVIYLELGADVKCDGDPLQHGSIKTGNGSGSALALGSQVEFQCDWGFRMEGISTGRCELKGDGPESLSVGPRWSHVPNCASTCLVPASVTNGSFVKSSPILAVNSTVTYSCDDPFVLNRQDPALTCVLGDTGTPHWNREVPACLIPDCSAPVSLTAAAGAFVNPSYPSPSVLGGHKNCQWTITVQAGMALNFNISYFDIPRGAQLSLLDRQTGRVLKLFHGGQSPSAGQRNFNISRDGVSVAYNGPDAPSDQHRGFYVSYRTVERSVPVVPTTPSTTHGVFSTTPITTSTPVYVGPSTDNPQERQTGDDSGSSAGKIAAGVVVPIVLLAIAGGVGFCCYRKKYPVRMTMGRTFAKFSNPQYNTPHTAHTLVREDASDFFRNQLQMQPENVHSQVSIILGGDEEHSVQYVNTAFQYDTHDVDEEEVERRFREKKAYLFKKDDEEKTDEEKKTSTSDGKSEAPTSNKTKKQGLDQGHENKAYVDSEGETGENGRSGNESDSSSTSSDIPISIKNKTPSDNNLKDSEKNDAAEDDRVKGASETTLDEVDGGRTDIPSTFNSGFNPKRRDLAAEIAQGMTVKEFLIRAREQRTMSDVTRGRSGSLPVVDYTKSARRRAQSTGDVFANVAIPSTGAPKVSPTAVLAESSTNTEQPQHTEHVKLPFLEESTENLTSVPDEVSHHGETDEMKRLDDSISENNHGDKVAEPILSLTTERDIAKQPGQPDGISSASDSDSDEEGSLPPGSPSTGVLVSSLRSSPSPTHEDQLDSSQGEQEEKGRVATSNQRESSPSTEGEFYFVNKVPGERGSGASSSATTDEVSANVKENTVYIGNDFHEELLTESSEIEHVAASPHENSPYSEFVIVPSSSAGGILTNVNDELNVMSIGESDFDSDDVTDSHRRSDEEVDEEARTSSHMPELAESSHKLSSSETPIGKKAISVEGLSSIAYSDDSSPSSSNESEAESDAGEYQFGRGDSTESPPSGTISWKRRVKPNISESSDEDDSADQHSQFTLIGASSDAQQPSHPELPAESPPPLQFTFSSGGSPSPRPPSQEELAAPPSPPSPQMHRLRGLAALRETPPPLQFTFSSGGSPDPRPPSQEELAAPPSPPSPQLQRMRGLAALRTHPAARQRDSSSHNESSDDDTELTTEDVEKALMEAGDDSSDEELARGPLPPLPYAGPPSMVTLKLDPTDTFVFDEEENEDFDV